MPPSSRSQSAATTALRKVHSELFRVKRLREIPHWWILVRCLPPSRGRGEQRRPLRRRVGNMGACPPPHRGRSAVCRPSAAMYLFGRTIELHVDFDSTAAWRHHVSMRPSSRSQSAATTALAGGTLELFRVKRWREIPQWRILGRCGPPTRYLEVLNFIVQTSTLSTTSVTDPLQIWV